MRDGDPLSREKIVRVIAEGIRALGEEALIRLYVTAGGGINLARVKAFRPCSSLYSNPCRDSRRSSMKEVGLAPLGRNPRECTSSTALLAAEREDRPGGVLLTSI